MQGQTRLSYVWSAIDKRNMALSSARRLSHYGAIVRDSTVVQANVPFPKVCVPTSTVQHLVDPKTNEELCIIGTTNMSTRLALRTKRLIAQYQPNAVLVQASPDFFQLSRVNAESQEELDTKLEAYRDLLDQAGALEWNMKDTFYFYRRLLMSLFIHQALKTPWDWEKLFVPGLEMKYALDYAEAQKAQVYYAGEEFNRETHERLKMQRDFDVIWPMIYHVFGLNTHWRFEARDMGRLFQFTPLKDLCENHFDKNVMAWWVRYFDRMLPGQKRSLINQRDEDMFIAVEKKLTGNKKLAVVNQWHMEGLEKLWRLHHGIEEIRPATNGAEDFPLAENQAYIDGIDKDRAEVERRTGAPMASSHRTLVAYNDETRSHYG